MLSLLTMSAAAIQSSAQPDLTAVFSAVVDYHISEIMPLFLNDELNFEWADRMIHQETVHTREGEFCYQQHSMPWPLAPRDLLLRCKGRTRGQQWVI